MNLRQINFPLSQYVNDETVKKQIFLHHTAGNSNPIGVFDYWKTTKERVATCVVIGGDPGTNKLWNDGEIIQGFSSKYWAYHLGLKESTFDKFNLPYKSLDKTSIGIEICNWGQLIKRGDKFYNYVNNVVPSNQVIELEKPYRGNKYYHSYTNEQIKSLKDLLLLWGDKYNIPLDFHEDIFDVTPRALKGDPGIFSHTSVRFDKNDVYPHPKLIEMLKSL